MLVGTSPPNARLGFFNFMANTSYYFSHDYNARNDDKIKSLIRKHQFLGYGIFWAIIEDLYNNANALRLDYEGIAFDMRVDEGVIKSIINDFGLFAIDGEYFGSLSVQRRIDEREEKSQKAKDSARKRWDKIEKDANALPTQSESNAIKESKGKEIKESKSIEERLAAFQQQLNPFVAQYGEKMIKDFYKYWIEMNNGGKKMRFEMEKIFNVSMRLDRWNRNNLKFGKPPQKDESNMIKLPDGTMIDKKEYAKMFG